MFSETQPTPDPFKNLKSSARCVEGSTPKTAKRLSPVCGDQSRDGTAKLYIFQNPAKLKIAPCSVQVKGDTRDKLNSPVARAEKSGTSQARFCAANGGRAAKPSSIPPCPGEKRHRGARLIPRGLCTMKLASAAKVHACNTLSPISATCCVRGWGGRR